MLGRAATAALRFPRTACGRSAHAHALHALAAAADSRAAERGPRAVGVAAVLARWPPARWATTEARSPAQGGKAPGAAAKKLARVFKKTEKDLPAKAPEDPAAPESDAKAEPWVKTLKKLRPRIKSNEVAEVADFFVGDRSRSAHKPSPPTADKVARLLSFIADMETVHGESAPQARLELVQAVIAAAEPLTGPIETQALPALLKLHADLGMAAEFEALLAKKRDADVYIKETKLLALESRAYMIDGQNFKGMQLWNKLARLDPSMFPYEHLITTLMLRRDTASAVRALESLTKKFKERRLSQTMLQNLCELLLEEKDFDGIVTLFRLTKSRKELHLASIGGQAACMLAVAGRHADALEILDVWRSKDPKPSVTHLHAEVVVRDALDQVDQLAPLLQKLAAIGFDSATDIYAECVLAARVGPVTTAAQVQQALATHEILIKMDPRDALRMLLNGYAGRGDSLSAQLVLEEFKKRRLGVPRNALARLTNMVLERFGPDTALGMISGMFEARVPFDNGRFRISDATRLVWDKHPELHQQIRDLVDSVQGLIDKNRKAVEKKKREVPFEE